MPEKTTAETGQWDEQKAVTGRPNDVPDDNTTFAARARARAKTSKKQVDKDAETVENKAVTRTETLTKRAR